LARALVETHDRIQVGDAPRPTAAWAELRGFQQGCQTQGIAVSVTQAEESDGAATVGAQIVQFSASGELDEARRMIAAMRNSPFWKARELAVRALRKVGLRTRA
jgi:hypothetical protein